MNFQAFAFFGSPALNWDEAMADCQSKGLRLLTIKSEDELHAVENFMNNNVTIMWVVQKYFFGQFFLSYITYNVHYYLALVIWGSYKICSGTRSLSYPIKKYYYSIFPCPQSHINVIEKNERVNCLIWNLSCNKPATKCCHCWHHIES